MLTITAKLLNPHLPSFQLAESPHWSSEGNCLSWVDIKKHKIYRYYLESGELNFIETNGETGFAIPSDQPDIFICGIGNDVCKANFKTGKIEKIYTVETREHHRLNDAKCDKAGRLWAGTMNLCEPPEPTAGLHLCDGQSFVTADSQFGISNGMGWSADEKNFYITDTAEKTIYVYDFLPDEGKISDRKVFKKLQDDGYPDGLCIDSQGRIFSCLFSQSRINIYKPDGSLEGQILLPVPQVTSCTFGGPDLRTLFITTAYDGMSEGQKCRFPLSGRIFKAEMREPGLPVHPAKLNETQ